MVARLSPFSTLSPTFLCRITPTERSISLSFVALPAAEVHRHKADMLGKNAPDIAGDLGRDFKLHLRVRQTRGVIDVIAVAVLRLETISGKLLRCRAALDSMGERGARVLDAFGDAAFGEDAAAERQAQLKQIALRLALEDGDSFLDLDGVARRRSRGADPYR